MLNDAKVVKLRQRDASRSALPAPLLRLRDTSAGHLQALLGDFFDEADNALFAMSDKAGTNSEQTAYFDAMRELRLQRKGLTLSFLQWIARAFNDIGQFEARRKNAAPELATDRDSLSLVDDSDLEEQVALDNMITKARNHYNEQILLLHVRLEHLLPAVKFRLDQTPLGPEVLCQGLGEACADLDVDIRARLVIFKLFDRLLMERLGPFYQEANAQLARDGVLPELRRPPLPGSGTRRRPASPSGSPVATAQVPIDGEAEAGPTFAELSDLLHRSGMETGFSIAGDAVQAGVAGSVGTDTLIALLGQVQGRLRQPGAALPAGANLQKLVSRLIAQRDQGKGQVEQVDADVINLVSMLFDFILEDRQLPEPMKALLARVQIPILKVALLDRSFFSRGGHPARKLLNELAMAAVGWQDRKQGQRDPLREKIESIVERFLNEFESDIGLVQDLLDDFLHFMDLDRRRRELVEQRLRDAEEGRARSLQAKEAVADILTRARDGHVIPEAAQPLIDDAWAKVLHWFYLREGETGENWRDAVATTESLVWSMDPRPIDGSTRATLLKAIPPIVDAVRGGLQMIGWDPFAADRLVRDLEMVHVDTLQNVSLLAEAPAVEADRTAAPAAKSGPDDVPDRASILDTQPPTTEDSGITAAEAAPVPPGLPESAIAAADLPVASPAGTGASTAPIDDIPVADHWLEQAQALRVGSWLELQEGEDRKLRCKLAALIKATGKYIFVNRSGTKVAEYSLADVATALREERLTLLDDGLIFDRALESVIGNLRSNRKD